MDSAEKMRSRPTTCRRGLLRFSSHQGPRRILTDRNRLFCRRRGVRKRLSCTAKIAERAGQPRSTGALASTLQLRRSPNAPDAGQLRQRGNRRLTKSNDRQRQSRIFRGCSRPSRSPLSRCLSPPAVVPPIPDGPPQSRQLHAQQDKERGRRHAFPSGSTIIDPPAIMTSSPAPPLLPAPVDVGAETPGGRGCPSGKSETRAN